MSDHQVQDSYTFCVNEALPCQEDHWFISHIYLTIPLGCYIYHHLGRKQT